jgi:hypothetical protein
VTTEQGGLDLVIGRAVSGRRILDARRVDLRWATRAPNRVLTRLTAYVSQ